LAESNRTNAIHRGAFFQTEVLCNTLPAIPGDVDTQGPLEDASLLPTARERLAPLLARSDCSGCHRSINPIGLAFENYHAIGRFRTHENDAPIDASGSIDLGEGEVQFSNAVELVEHVATSRKARECYSLQWYRAVLGRREFSEDACGLAVMNEVANQTEGDLRQMLLAVVQTDAFRYRRVTEP
jgi:hypothetical protein